MNTCPYVNGPHTPIDHGSVGCKADVVAESTAGAGVTVDGLKIKDGAIQASGVPSVSASAIPDGIIIKKLVAGDSAGAITVSGILVSDSLIGVIHHTAGALPADRLSETTITGDDEITTSTTDTTGDMLEVTWQIRA